MALFSRVSLITSLTAAMVCQVSGAPIPAFKPVPVDPLTKVFRDDAVRADRSNHMETARGQHVTCQLVLPAMPCDVDDLQCNVTTFTLSGGGNAGNSPAQLPASQVRYVGYVGGSVTAKKPGHDQLRAAPAMFPDPLLEQPKIDVVAGNNQPCWITVPVPVETQPGDYRATAVLSAKLFGQLTSASLPLTIKVYPAQVKDTRLNVVNWHQMWARGDQPAPEQYSPEWWDMLRTYAKDMVAHRQNWARVETLWIIEYGQDANG